MNQGLATLNTVVDGTVSFEEIKDPCGDIYCQVNSSTDASNVPSYVRKKLVQLVCLHDRCKEEQTLLKEEMLRFSVFLSGEINAISSFLSNEADVDRGLMSLLLQKVDVHQKNLQLLKRVCGHAVSFPPFEYPSETYFQFSALEIEETDDVEGLYDLSLFEDLECHSAPIRGWNDEESES